MSRFKIFVAVASLVLVTAFVSVPIVQAASLTSAQINAIVGLLRAFGADSTVVSNVEAVLSGKTIPQQPVISASVQEGITVSYPKGGENFKDGDRMSIKWATLYSNFLYYQVVLKNNLTNTLSLSIVNNSETPISATSADVVVKDSWVKHFTSNFSGVSEASLRNNFYVEVRANRSPVIGQTSYIALGRSKTFSIIKSDTAQPSITVISPTAGKTFIQGVDQTISWTKASGNFDFYMVSLANRLTGGNTSSLSVRGQSYVAISPNKTSVVIDGRDLSDNMIKNWLYNAAQSGYSVSEQDLRKNFYIKIIAEKESAKSFIVASGESGTIEIRAASQSLNLTNPLDGHLWTIGDNQVITWTSGGISSNVNGYITLRNSYGTTYTIPNVPNTGSYKWSPVGTINGKVIPAGNYAVQVTMGNLQSEGVGTLTIAVANQTPSITVTSPNGGETWQGKDVVQWKSDSIPSSNYVTIVARQYTDGYYLSNNYHDYVLVQSTQNDGNEYVDSTILPNSTKGPYSLQIKTLVNGKVVEDWSNSYFKVVNVSQSVAITSSSQTTSLTPTISGIASGLNQISVVISNTGGKVYGSGLISVVNGNWSVTVNPALTTGLYTIYVYDANNNLLITGDLSVTSSTTKPSITVTSPNGGEIITTVGGYITLPYSWKANYFVQNPILSIFRVESPNSNIFGKALASGISGSGTWNLGSSASMQITPGKYLIKICDGEKDAICDLSDNSFSVVSDSIQPLKASSVTIIDNLSTYPAGQKFDFSVKGVASDGNPGTPSKGFNVQAYESDGYNTVQVNGVYQSVNANYNSSTGYWDIVMTAPTDSSKLYTAGVSFYCSNSQLGCSNGQINQSFKFNVVSANPPSINALSSSGGGDWYKGQNTTVQWSTTNIPKTNNMLLRLRNYNTGVEYNLVNSINDGFETITVPTTIPVGSYMLEIKTEVNGVSYLYQSLSYFKIIDQNKPSITITTSGQVNSLTPTIYGTASGLNQVGIVLSNSSGKVYGSGLIPVTNGSWSVVVSPALTVGQYTIYAYDANNNQMANSYIKITSVSGDLNQDGLVNEIDVDIMRSVYLTKIGDNRYRSDADLNGDGVINAFDLLELRKIVDLKVDVNSDDVVDNTDVSTTSNAASMAEAVMNIIKAFAR